MFSSSSSSSSSSIVTAKVVEPGVVHIKGFLSPKEQHVLAKSLMLLGTTAADMDDEYGFYKVIMKDDGNGEKRLNAAKTRGRMYQSIDWYEKRFKCLGASLLSTQPAEEMSTNKEATTTTTTTSTSAAAAASAYTVEGAEVNITNDNQSHQKEDGEQQQPESSPRDIKTNSEQNLQPTPTNFLEEEDATTAGNGDGDGDGDRMTMMEETLRLLSGISSHAVKVARGADPSIPEMKATHLLTLLYAEKTGIRWHRDDGENDGTKEKPVVSFSLGNACTFRTRHTKKGTKKTNVNGEEEDEKEREIRLESGDCLIFGGPARMIYHAVTHVFKGTSPLPEDNPLGDARMNLTFREAPEILGREEEFRYFIPSNKKTKQDIDQKKLPCP